VAVHYPIRAGCTPPLDFKKSFLRQVGQAGKNGSILDNSVLNAFISSGQRKQNYRRLEEGRIFFYLEQKFLFDFQPSHVILLFLTKHRNYWQSHARQNNNI